MIQIVTNHDELAIPCERVVDFNQNLPFILEAQEWVSDKGNNALGLAAPQIGIRQRWFVMLNPFSAEVFVVINPRATFSGGTKQLNEACFSAPGEVYQVARRSVVDSTFTTIIDGVFKKVTRIFTGQSAQIFQHELDHIKGKCIFHKGVKVK